jgi:drug/metabolite transporter (DMT)-like permease
MGVGWFCLVLLSIPFGDYGSLLAFGAREWAAMAFVAVAGGAVMFLLFFFAVGRTGATAAAVTVTANPVTAALTGALLLSEPLGFNLLIGLAAVIAGIWIAASAPAPGSAR